ncbi:zinc finger CCCH domain-containing protein 20-like [Cucurbita moschata]|uniref:Zinc finger CCCH domain-containing protein 20-like n=1 Tax=Cucurbita moschata TaxID=3662 RepID=A0A6J1F0X6_CUCMO|nr:zinc finger CCCH domain-containing protein 20-like [Cucurbita moschata]
MVIGQRHRPGPLLHITPLTIPEEPANQTRLPFPLSGISVSSDDNANGGDYSPYHLQEVLAAFQRYLPSTSESEIESNLELSGRESDVPVDAYSCDQFRIFEFKVRKCTRGRSHDWTECPFAHPGEKARRRDPRKYHYSGTACPDFRKGSCKKGESCEFAHGVFECWLHPSRYRTQPCKDGINCRRRVCFFAHTPEQLRVLPQQSPRDANSPDSYEESPLRQCLDGTCAKSLPFLSSPVSVSPSATPVDSPPISPMTRSLARSLGSSSVNEIVASLHMHLSKVNSLPSSWNVQIGSPGYPSRIRPGFCSLPTTPTQPPTGPGVGLLDFTNRGFVEEPAMERVESGRELRAKMLQKLSEENSLDLADSGPSDCTPDVEWVSDLVN